MFRHFWIVALLVAPTPMLAGDPKPMKFTVGKLERTALVASPAGGKGAAPLVFVFHGHRGTSQDGADGFKIHEFWPEAICVYPQGLKTVTKSDPKGEFSGWQNQVGDDGDRDLKFFDVMLTDLKRAYKVDEKRVYAAGFSNGAGFTFVLWGERGDMLAAVGVLGSVAGGKKAKELKPKPCIYLAGQKDEGFAGQQKMMETVKSLNGCDPAGQPYAKMGKKKDACETTLYPSKMGTPLVTGIHPGDHMVPNDTGRLMVRFFKENEKK